MRMSGSCSQPSSPTSPFEGTENGHHDGNLSGASSEPPVPPQGGAVGPHSMDMLMKKIFAYGDSPSIPGLPKGGMPDMMSLMKGGMPFPDMMSMMCNGDMSAMMGKAGMNGNPMGMANLFNCIVEMSLALVESEESDCEVDAITVQVPCDYCPRFFVNQMSLKTHILVAHEHEDSSVLNLTNMTTDTNGNHNTRNDPKRKLSQDIDIFAAEASCTNIQTLTGNAESQRSPCPVYSSSAADRGIKRGRTESKDLETTEDGGAAGVEDSLCEKVYHMDSSSKLASETSACVMETRDSDIPEQTPVLGSHCVSKQSAIPSPTKYKKIKGHDLNSDSNEDGMIQNNDESGCFERDCQSPCSCFQRDVKNNCDLTAPVKGNEASEITDSERSVCSDVCTKDSSDKAMSPESSHAAAAAGPSN